MKNYIVICKGKRAAMAKLRLIIGKRKIKYEKSDRKSAVICTADGDTYYWVVPSKNLDFDGTLFERAYVECQTNMKSVFYREILTPAVRHEEYFDGSLLDGTAFIVTDDDMDAIWNGSWSKK